MTYGGVYRHRPRAQWDRRRRIPPRYITSSTAKLGLTVGTPSTVREHFLRVTTRKVSVNTFSELTVELRQGTTLIEAYTISPGPVWSTHEHAFAESNISTITDYAALEVWFTFQYTGTASDHQIAHLEYLYPTASSSDVGSTPAALAVTTVFPAPTLRGDANTAPAALLTPVTFPAATPRVDAFATPAALAVTVTHDAPAVTGDANTAPTALVVTTTLDTPTLSVDVSATPATLVVSYTFDAPTLSVEVIATPTALIVSYTFDTPALSAGGSRAPPALVVTTTHNTPTVTGSANTAPVALAVTTTFSTPTLRGDANTAPASLLVQTTFPAPTLSVDVTAALRRPPGSRERPGRSSPRSRYQCSRRRGRPPGRAERHGLRSSEALEMVLDEFHAALAPVERGHR